VAPPYGSIVHTQAVVLSTYLMTRLYISPQQKHSHVFSCGKED